MPASAKARSKTAAAAGYSATPLPKKLGIKTGHRVLLVAEPTPPITALHAHMPPGVTLSRRRGAQHDVIVLFVPSRAALVKQWDALVASLHTDGGLWVVWPKKHSGVPTDLTEDVIRAFALAKGLVDNKVCAVDATWSGLRLVRRVKDRGRPPRSEQ